MLGRHGVKVAADHTLDSLIDGDFLTDPERKIALAVHLASGRHPIQEAQL
jgi:hypothetical protein